MHIAIIPDGNRRWAKDQKLSVRAGYEKGIDVIQLIVGSAIKCKVSHLTFFAMSSENVKRASDWIIMFKSLIEHSIHKLTQKVIAQGCKIRFLGDKNALGHDLGKKLKSIENMNPDTLKLHLNLCFGYSGREDIQQATVKAMQAHQGDITPFLWTAGIPDPDIIIRTSGEMRISNFMLYQSAYSELFFIEEHWPDFTAEKFEYIINQFHSRERRFGK